MKPLSFILLVALAGFSSCNIQKRLYRDGFYIDRKGAVEQPVAHAEHSGFYKNGKKISPPAGQLRLQEKVAQNVPVIDHADTPVFSSPVISVPQQEAGDTLRSQRKQKAGKDSGKKFTSAKAGRALLIGLGACLAGALLVLGTGFKYDTMLQAVGMLLAIILIAVGMVFLYYGIIVLIVLGIISLRRRNREKKQQKATT